jgi:hypothetical protein
VGHCARTGPGAREQLSRGSRRAGCRAFGSAPFPGRSSAPLLNARLFRSKKYGRVSAAFSRKCDGSNRSRVNVNDSASAGAGARPPRQVVRGVPWGPAAPGHEAPGGLRPAGAGGYAGSAGLAGCEAGSSANGAERRDSAASGLRRILPAVKMIAAAIMSDISAALVIRAIGALPAACRHLPVLPARIEIPHAGPTGAGVDATPHLPGPRGARLTIKWLSLCDLDFFWRTGTNHCKVISSSSPVGGGTKSLRGVLASGRSPKPWYCASACLGPLRPGTATRNYL